jgi:hypothetical protein
LIEKKKWKKSMNRNFPQPETHKNIIAKEEESEKHRETRKIERPQKDLSIDIRLTFNNTPSISPVGAEFTPDLANSGIINIAMKFRIRNINSFVKIRSGHVNEISKRRYPELKQIPISFYPSLVMPMRSVQPLIETNRLTFTT